MGRPVTTGIPALRMIGAGMAYAKALPRIAMKATGAPPIRAIPYQENVSTQRWFATTITLARQTPAIQQGVVSSLP
jgi:hypothetical protein